MIETEDIGASRVLRLAHGKANALDIELVQALTSEVARADRDGCRALVVTSTGSIFCAGVDLFRVAAGGAEYVRRFLPAFRDLMFTLFSVEIPVITAANGHAIAGGAVLVAIADYRLMSEGGGRMGYTELLVGVPFPPAALEVIRFGTPARWLENILFGAATYPGAEARELDLIDELVAPDELVPRALEVADGYCRTTREAFALTKRHLRAATIARMREVEATYAGAVTEQWCAAPTHAKIREYLDRTVGRR